MFLICSEVYVHFIAMKTFHRKRRISTRCLKWMSFRAPILTRDSVKYNKIHYIKKNRLYITPCCDADLPTSLDLVSLGWCTKGCGSLHPEVRWRWQSRLSRKGQGRRTGSSSSRRQPSWNSSNTLMWSLCMEWCQKENQ